MIVINLFQHSFIGEFFNFIVLTCVLCNGHQRQRVKVFKSKNCNFSFRFIERKTIKNRQECLEGSGRPKITTKKTLLTGAKGGLTRADRPRRGGPIFFQSEGVFPRFGDEKRGFFQKWNFWANLGWIKIRLQIYIIIYYPYMTIKIR